MLAHVRGTRSTKVQNCRGIGVCTDACRLWAAGGIEKASPDSTRALCSPSASRFEKVAVVGTLASTAQRSHPIKLSTSPSFDLNPPPWKCSDQCSGPPGSQHRTGMPARSTNASIRRPFEAPHRIHTPPCQVRHPTHLRQSPQMPRPGSPGRGSRQI